MAHRSGVLAVEMVNGNQMALFTRTETIIEPFSPWLLLETPEDVGRAELDGVSKIVPLKGGGEFRHRVHFHTWNHFLDARDRLVTDGILHFNINTPVRQHLTLTGQTLFRDMRYDDLHRLQLDIETLSLDPEAPTAEIIIISITDTQGFETVLSGLNHAEPDLLQHLNRIIQERDPDVIEGHNLFEFDLPYIAARAQVHNVTLNWGRDGSPLRAGHGRQRYKVGAQRSDFRPSYIHGRHIIDTLPTKFNATTLVANSKVTASNPWCAPWALNAKTAPLSKAQKLPKLGTPILKNYWPTPSMTCVMCAT